MVNFLLSGRERGSSAPGWRGAVERLRGFRFIGIFEEWQSSICLYHRMIMRDRPCVEVEFAIDNQEVAIGDPQLGAQVLEAAGLALDPEDTPFYQAARRLFFENVRRYEVTEESCAAIRSRAARSSPERGASSSEQ